MGPKKRTKSPAAAKRSPSPAPFQNKKKNEEDAVDAVYCKIFDSIDTDKSGYIDFDELYIALVSHHKGGKHLTPVLVMSMLEEADGNDDGLIDVQEFITIMKTAKSSKYWKNASNSLLGCFSAAINETASMGKAMLQPVHRATAMHATPITDESGQFKELGPGLGAILIGNFFAYVLYFIWLFVPCFAWGKGKDLGGYLMGYHHERKDGKRATSGDMAKLFLMTFLAIYVATLICYLPPLFIIPLTLCFCNMYYILFTDTHQNIVERFCELRPVVDTFKSESYLLEHKYD